MNTHNPMPNTTHENPNLSSAPPPGSGRGKWTPPSAKTCSWERCQKKAVINHRIFGPLCWWHLKTAKLSICCERVRTNDEHQRWEPAAADTGIASNLNGWLPSAGCSG